MTPQIFGVICLGAIAQVLGESILFSKEEIEDINLNKGLADINETSTFGDLLDAMGDIPTETPLGSPEGDDEETTTAEEPPNGEPSGSQAPTSTPDYSVILAVVLVTTISIFAVLVVQFLLMAWVTKKLWLSRKRADYSQEVRGQNHGFLLEVHGVSSTVRERANPSRYSGSRMRSFETGPECFAKNHIWQLRGAENALAFLGPFIHCRMLVENEVMTLDSRYYYVVNRGRLKIPANDNEVHTILTSGSSFGESGLIDPVSETRKNWASNSNDIMSYVRKSFIQRTLALPDIRRGSMDAPVHSEEARAIEWCDIRYVEIRVCRDVLNVHGHFLRDLREILLHPPRVVPAALDDGIEKKKQRKKSSRPPWGYGLPLSKRGSTLQPSPRVLLKRPQPLIRGEIEAWAMEESMKQKHAVDMRVGNYCPGKPYRPTVA
ncbi:hypothetical protein Pmar_PMAR005309 [Perkinsus marinus ATCC 50983]|uniref:Cyclic nucleotide-binding domain-containing protein n=1 Tax=Perkinsus marinus (strain ATCC 50983 / TXsc) TaxID=423536 RepID=C5KB72_PERM5|nr:hypothetical protein Pmar_PMAR005309 [Perkinsus marinus ATCC 50983]EER18398.1 hypothetical protein Pmar_PMAR005309 [Perkinsus marinus ATCC 50983]|eukprot:XP_002786602.1 hypothetical protein Pmar_PMAR005309 [Perkinsus marinus ATCC 50983]